MQRRQPRSPPPNPRTLLLPLSHFPRTPAPTTPRPPSPLRSYDPAAAGPGSNVGLQSPLPPCHFYVDHTYRLLYVRSTKTAGTTISETFGMKENPVVCK